MAQIKSFLVIIFILFFISGGFASTPYCQNLSFEMLNFTNWTGYTWAKGQPGIVVSMPKVEGIVSGRQTIVTQQGYDPIVENNQLKRIPDGFSQSVKLGTTNFGDGGLRQNLIYTLDVSEENAFVIYHFAVVLQDPYDEYHAVEDEPRFTVSVSDEGGNSIKSCYNYDVHATEATIKGFRSFMYNTGYGVTPVYWRDWTAVGMDLTQFIGQKITLEFMSANCTRRGHFGYAYFVVECMPMQINMEFCAADNQARLYAPNGFEKYLWIENGVAIGNAQTLTIENPIEGQTYQCELTSETGCVATVSTAIQRYFPSARFAYRYDCNSNTATFSNSSSTNSGTLQYLWDFGDGVTSNEINPVHTFTTGKQKIVKLTTNNLPSTCSDTYIDTINVFDPHLIVIEGDSLYCPNKTVALIAKGAYHYVWSTGDTVSVINVGREETIWVTGTSEDGSCQSDTAYFKLKQKPDWDFTIEGESSYCESGNTTIRCVSDSKNLQYAWSTGDTTPAITVSTPGNYFLTVKNAGECIEEKTRSITIVEHPKPEVDFVFSKQIFDIKDNSVSASITPEQNTVYTWNMGDGTELTGSSITHNYTIDYNKWSYPVTLKATSEYGCEKDTVQYANFSVFIPNVFTPNSDNVNDVFMTNVDLTIYDRNGIKIYEGKNGWDGNFKGEKADNDTYFYLIKYPNAQGSTQTSKGFIVLKR